MANLRTSEAEVSYPGKACTLKAFTARPAAEVGARPAVIVVHEWWGLDEHIQGVTRRFAAEGYFAVAPDLYSRQGHKVTVDPNVAGELMGGLAMADGIDDLLSTIGWIKAQPAANGARIGVTGFCMGGSYATLLPCVSAEIKAAAPFYGEIPADSELAKLACPMFYAYGENDGWIQRADVDRLAATLKRLGKPGEVKVYPGCSHGFFNDSHADIYSAADAHDAWSRMNKLFAATLKG
ncbi:MAG: dienelactone hydrolase family protein [Candidatus Binataceae bacterium]|nr:dienelactone hydrolase family protein [Candidatus Binataceae bacterium]